MKRKQINQLQQEIKETKRQVDEMREKVNKRLEKKQTFMRYMFYGVL